VPFEVPPFCANATLVAALRNPTRMMFLIFMAATCANDVPVAGAQAREAWS
jgi:hypothetical protein